MPFQGVACTLRLWHQIAKNPIFRHFSQQNRSAEPLTRRGGAALSCSICRNLMLCVIFCRFKSCTVWEGQKGRGISGKKKKQSVPCSQMPLKSPLEAPRAVLRACLVSFPTYPLQKRVHVPESLLWRFCSSSSFSFLLLMPFPTVKTCRISPLNAVFPPRFFRAR